MYSQPLFPVVHLPLLGEKLRVRLENEWLAKMMRVKAVTNAQGKPIPNDFLLQER